MQSAEQGSVLNLEPLECGNGALTSKTPPHTHTDQELSEQEKGRGASLNLEAAQRQTHDSLPQK